MNWFIFWHKDFWDFNALTRTHGGPVLVLQIPLFESHGFESRSDSFLKSQCYLLSRLMGSLNYSLKWVIGLVYGMCPSPEDKLPRGISTFVECMTTRTTVRNRFELELFARAGFVTKWSALDRASAICLHRPKNQMSAVDLSWADGLFSRSPSSHDTGCGVRKSTLFESKGSSDGNKLVEGMPAQGPLWK